MTTQEYFERIRNTEKGFFVARAALRFCVMAHRKQILPELRESTDPKDAEYCLENLESIFVIKMFTDFEAALRDYWKFRLGKSTAPQMETLINSIGARIRADSLTLHHAHSVRELRNDLIHNIRPKARISIEQCGKRLRAFLSYFEKGQWKLKLHP